MLLAHRVCTRYYPYLMLLAIEPLYVQTLSIGSVCRIFRFYHHRHRQLKFVGAEKFSLYTIRHTAKFMKIHLNKYLNKMNKTPHYEEISHNILIRQLLLEDQRLQSMCLELHTTVLKLGCLVASNTPVRLSRRLKPKKSLTFLF